MSKKKVTVYFRPEDHEAFKAACKNNDTTMSAKLLAHAKAFTKKDKKNG